MFNGTNIEEHGKQTLLMPVSPAKLEIFLFFPDGRNCSDQVCMQQYNLYSFKFSHVSQRYARTGKSDARSRCESALTALKCCKSAMYLTGTKFIPVIHVGHASA